MMERVWNEILNRFGQEVTLHGEEQDLSFRAIIQPWLDSEKGQEVPGALGLGRKDRFRYMGPAQYPLELDSVVEWKGQEYRVQSAHLVGEGVCPHWWAVIYPRDEVVL